MIVMDYRAEVPDLSGSGFSSPSSNLLAQIPLFSSR